MRNMLVAALGAVLLVGVSGCQNDGGSDDADVTVRTERTDTMRGADDCAMCEGTQTARTDGSCPQCGMKVRTSSR